MSATQTKSSHAYGIGILVVIVALGVSITWYTSYWLPEENQKVFVDEHILFPDGETVVNIIMGSATPEQKDNYMPKKIQVQLTICLLYTSPSPRDKRQSRMPSSA